MKCKKYIWVMIIAASLGCAIVVEAQEIPFIESFDDRTEGALHDQNEWAARSQNDA